MVRCGVALTVVALVAAGCGGGQRQDANEPSGNYKVAILRASFPAKQAVAQTSTMTIAVKNVDTRPIPNIAVTVKSFSRRMPEPNLSDPERPVFVINQAPQGGDTAYVDTWALGPLRPGQIRIFQWNVTAVQPTRFHMTYRVAAGLNGKAKAVLASGGIPSGVFDGKINGAAPKTEVNFENGKQVQHQTGPVPR